MNVKLQVEITSKYPREMPRVRVVQESYSSESGYFNHVQNIVEELHQAEPVDEAAPVTLSSCYIYQIIENTRVTIYSHSIPPIYSSSSPLL